MHKRLVLQFTLCSLLGLASTSYASTWMEDVWSSIGNLDQDENGKISHEEYTTYWQKKYDLADINKDGEISNLEWRLVLEGKKMTNETTKILDKNNDDDSDSDIEARALIETKPMDGHTTDNSRSNTNRLIKLDHNNDDEINKYEFIQYWSEMYGKADLNEDGKVSKHEIRTMFESERGLVN